MNRGTRPNRFWLVLALGAGLLGGCVERRFVIYSDPPGAIVYENGQPLGAAPADNHFVYYGTYRFTLVKDGFQTLVVDQPVPAPWYEFPGLDFISENLVPWTIRDVRRFTYTMQPMQVANPTELLNQAQGLRNQGQALQPPPTAPLPPGGGLPAAAPLPPAAAAPANPAPGS